MIAALSVRIAEHPKDKSSIATDVVTLAELAKAARFEAISLRASVVGVHSSPATVRAVRAALNRVGLGVSMVTGDLSLAVNDARATEALRNMTPYLTLAEQMGARLVRVMVHEESDVPAVRRAADEAMERGIGLAQPCHWGSAAETVDESLALVAAVGRTNFGITFEPANLLACGDDAGTEAVRRLAHHIVNVYFQNLRLDPKSKTTFLTRRRGPVGVRYLPIGDPSGIDPRPIVDTLHEVGYSGWFTVHQPLLSGQSVPEAIGEAGRLVDELLDRDRRA